MKITFGIVVYHEPEFLERCLRSIQNVADEIIVVHDGPCEDTTVAVAKQYTDRVIIGERLGGSDPHRISILKKAAHDWVFMIDADESLSPELTEFIRQLQNKKEPVDAGAFAFRWPLWDGLKEITSTNTRPCLFDRRQAWAIGLHNFPIHTVGKLVKRPEVLIHRPKHNKVGLSLLRGRLATRVARDAAQFALGWDKLSFYNQQLVPESFREQFMFFTKHPLWCAHINLFKHFLGSYRNVWRDGWVGFVLSLQLGLYQYLLAKKLWKIQNQK